MKFSKSKSVLLVALLVSSCLLLGCSQEEKNAPAWESKDSQTAELKDANSTAGTDESRISKTDEEQVEEKGVSGQDDPSPSGSDDTPTNPRGSANNSKTTRDSARVPGAAKNSESLPTSESAPDDGNDLKTVETRLEKIDPPTEEAEEEFVEIQTIEIPKEWKRLSPQHEIWLDTKNKQVIAGGRICLDRGGLEMFICPEGTKEHESIIAIRAESFQVHACLIALGINPGKPVDWGPPYKMATGPKIKISVMWVDDGKLGEDIKNEWDFPEQKQPEKVFPIDSDKIKRKDGRQMVRNAQTQKELDVHWVFGGSITEEFPDGTSHYYGNGGELVCVSNFATATMDLPIKSSQAKGNLMFEANTDKIPPRGTKVYVIFEAAEKE